MTTIQGIVQDMSDMSRTTLDTFSETYPALYAFTAEGVAPDLTGLLLAIDRQPVRLAISDIIGHIAQSLITFAPVDTNYPRPVITSAVASPANASRGNSITITWQADTLYNKYLIWWTVNGVAQPQGEVDVEGTTGSWTADTEPGYKYIFSVNGGQSGGLNLGYQYSGWGPQKEVSSVPNLRNLRGFLVAGNADFAGKSIRAIMSPYRSLLIYMDLRTPNYEGPAAGDPAGPDDPYSVYTDH